MGDEINNRAELERQERIASLRRQREKCRRNINRLGATRLGHGANVPLEITERRQKC
jgi:hypothetical protein